MKVMKIRNIFATRFGTTIIPELEKIRPGFKTAAARSIELIAEAAETLRDVAEGRL